MDWLNVALLQLMPADTLEGNLEKGLSACRLAKSQGADVALFPEMWSNGYSLTGDGEKTRRGAIGMDSAYVEGFRKAASRLGMAIAATFLESYEPSPRNTAIVVDRYGEVALCYAKVHTCAHEAGEAVLTPGEGFPICDLDTAKGKVKVGAMICYDREFPECGRSLMRKGAEILLVPNASPMDAGRISQLSTRAFENMICVATCNYPYGHADCNGHSTAFDGASCSESGLRGTLLMEAGESEGVYMARFPLAELRKRRDREMLGSAWRRPKLYSVLAGQE
jgi:predicted amidohydrolase